MIHLGFWPCVGLFVIGWGLFSFGVGRLVGTAIHRAERMGGQR